MDEPKDIIDDILEDAVILMGEYTVSFFEGLKAHKNNETVNAVVLKLFLLRDSLMSADTVRQEGYAYFTIVIIRCSLELCEDVSFLLDTKESDSIHKTFLKAFYNSGPRITDEGEIIYTGKKFPRHASTSILSKTRSLYGGKNNAMMLMYSVFSESVHGKAFEILDFSLGGHKQDDGTILLGSPDKNHRDLQSIHV